LTDEIQRPFRAPTSRPGRSAAPTSTRFSSTLKTWIVAGLVGVVLLSATVAAAGAASGDQPTGGVQATVPPSAEPTPDPSQPSESAPTDPSSAVPPSEETSVVVSDSIATDPTVLALLATIPVKGKAPKTGYERIGMFGSAWLDVDRNGCDTRNDILARDLTALVTFGTCKVMSGNLVSPFTAESISFVRGQDTSALVQIDHVVALSNAWQTGAQQLTQAQRVSLANDPINLLAVDGGSNAKKGDGDAATWLPSNKAFRCGYVARQVSVKATYGLWVTPAERDAMTRVLNSCPGELALTSSFTPAPAPVPAPAPAPAPAPEVYYESCTAVRAAGAAPIRLGEPGYSTKLDRDKDGIACDT
jgi:hypothetical protein